MQYQSFETGFLNTVFHGHRSQDNPVAGFQDQVTQHVIVGQIANQRFKTADFLQHLPFEGHGRAKTVFHVAKGRRNQGRGR